MGPGGRRHRTTLPAAGALSSAAAGLRTARQRIGAEAETLAEEHLVMHGHRILLRNYRCRMGELDLVARDAAGALVIAEVRMRSRSDFGGGAASVDHRKQQRILRASRHLLARYPELARSPVRFDVLDIGSPGEAGSIQWIRHAFAAT